MNVIHADTAQEMREEVVLFLKNEEARERKNIASHKTMRDKQAQTARANALKNLVMFFEDVKVVPRFPNC